MIALAVAVSLILHAALRKMTNKKRVMLYLLLYLGVVGEFNPPIHFVQIIQVKNFPQVYSWLKTTPEDAAIIEMPIYNWNMFPFAKTEQMRDYYSIQNFRKTVNGASGFSPLPLQEKIITLMEYFPSENSLRQLKIMGVKYLIFHKKEYDQLYLSQFAVNGHVVQGGESMLVVLLENKKIHLVKRYGDDYIFRL